MAVNVLGCTKEIKDAYDHYLEEDLPRMGWSRSFTGEHRSEVLALSSKLNHWMATDIAIVLHS